MIELTKLIIFLLGFTVGVFATIGITGAVYRSRLYFHRNIVRDEIDRANEVIAKKQDEADEDEPIGQILDYDDTEYYHNKE